MNPYHVCNNVCHVWYTWWHFSPWPLQYPIEGVPFWVRVFCSYSHTYASAGSLIWNVSLSDTLFYSLLLFHVSRYLEGCYVFPPSIFTCVCKENILCCSRFLCIKINYVRNVTIINLFFYLNVTFYALAIGGWWITLRNYNLGVGAVWDYISHEPLRLRSGRKRQWAMKRFYLVLLQ